MRSEVREIFLNLCALQCYIRAKVTLLIQTPKINHALFITPSQIAIHLLNFKYFNPTSLTIDG